VAHARGLSIGLKNDPDQAGVLFEGILALPAFTFATQISWIFAWSTKSTRIVGVLVLFLRILCLLLPAATFGMLSSAMFQSVGKGFYALIMTLIRTLVFTVFINNRSDRGVRLFLDSILQVWKVSQV